MNISIFGLGYVGAVSLACLARDGHHVIGVDVDQAKLDLIAAGKTPVVEEGMVDLMRDVVASGRVSVTRDVGEAVMGSDLSLVCVGTPSAPNGSQDQSAMLRLAEDLGAALRDKSEPHVIVFRSTLVPGTVEDVLRPIIETALGQEGRRRLPRLLPARVPARGIVDPRLRQAAVHDRRGEFGSAVASRCASSSVTCPASSTRRRCARPRWSSTAATTSTRSRSPSPTRRRGICEGMGVDPFEVMDLVCKDRQLNISPAYLKPGFAFGGSCLPKDLRATMYLAKMRDVDLPMHGAHPRLQPPPHRPCDRQGHGARASGGSA